MPSRVKGMVQIAWAMERICGVARAWARVAMGGEKKPMKKLPRKEKKNATGTAVSPT